MSAMPTPPDVVAAIGEPPEPRAWPTEEESGLQMKIKARRMIDDKELKTPEEARAMFRARIAALGKLKGVVSLKTAEVWYRMEQQFLRSALKYFRELNAIKESFKE